MAKRQTQTPKFAICIQTADADLLIPRMIYQVLPDESAARSNYIRVIDNEGEDYLYPADYFILIDLPREVQRALLRVALYSIKLKKRKRASTKKLEVSN